MLHMLNQSDIMISAKVLLKTAKRCTDGSCPSMWNPQMWKCMSITVMLVADTKENSTSRSNSYLGVTKKQWDLSLSVDNQPGGVLPRRSAFLFQCSFWVLASKTCPCVGMVKKMPWPFDSQNCLMNDSRTATLIYQDRNVISFNMQN